VSKKGGVGGNWKTLPQRVAKGGTWENRGVIRRLLGETAASEQESSQTNRKELGATSKETPGVWPNQLRVEKRERT